MLALDKISKLQSFYGGLAYLITTGAAYMIQTYRAAIYLRLSKEDGDFSISTNKHESNSISSQRALIEQYIRRSPDIELAGEYCDDGYTGTNFDRPGFQEMMADIKLGKINCVIVKDLSRFGRDYIDTGRYLEKEFPRLGVRFISINDSFDSLLSGGGADHIIIPFKNLINDEYARDISGKVRSTQQVKREKGDFIANFAVYGYKRSEADKNKIVVDEYPAGVVREIFSWFIGGTSALAISERLNGRGEPSPLEYKQNTGCKLKTRFKSRGKALWSATAVLRILSNEMYTGIMVQGKRTSINHKLKKAYARDKSEWVRVPQTHEAIISHGQFDLVQGLLNKNSSTLFAGILFCGTCGSPIKRHTVSSGGRHYVYCTCPNCPGHRISEAVLQQTVLAILQSEINTILNIADTLDRADSLSWEQHEIRKLDNLILIQKGIIEKNVRLKMNIYEDLRDGIIEKEEFSQFKQEFDQQIREAEAVIEKLEADRRGISEGLQTQKGWLAQFREYKNITELDRTVVVNLIDKITLFNGKQLAIKIRHKDHFDSLREIYQKTPQPEQSTPQRKEAI